MRAARRATAVLKTKLITLRSSLPDVLIFVFEGDDDKIVYGQWVKRIRSDLQYEPFPCGGKEGVRELKNSVTRDLAGLGERVFFFVDRDFDDMQGFIDSSNVFMTETYSVENCLVGDEVLESLLRDEFPCHARPEIRKSIVEIFIKDYEDFLAAVTEVNHRLFIARRIPIELTAKLRSSIKSLVIVRVGNVSGCAIAVEEVVVLAREPTADEQLALAAEFAALAPRPRFRGKFALKFFMEWLGKLADEWAAGNPSLFGSDPPKGGVRRAEFALSNFATKCKLPTGLPAFIRAIE